MSPRLKRYLTRAFPRVGLFLLLVLLCNLAAHYWNIEWLRIKFWSALTALVVVMTMSWYTRANPQDSD